MEDKDFIFQDEVLEKGPFEVGSIIIVNGENFTLTGLVEVRNIQDYLGFPSLYSWYEAKNDSNEIVNLFFFDEDIDSVEKNKAVAKKWWEESYRN